MALSPLLFVRRAGWALTAIAALTALHCTDDDGTSIDANQSGADEEEGDIMLFSGDEAEDAGFSPSGTDDYGVGMGEDGGGGSACGELVGLGECGGSTQEAEFKDLNILLVIDKSSSMVDTPEGFELNKWGALKSALGEALDNVKGQVSFGLELYPHSTTTPIAEECETGCCQVPEDADAITVPIEDGITGVPKILDELDDTSPGGGTPTAVALERALQYFESAEGAELDGERFVLLATDGGPNCNPDNSCSEPEECTPYLDNLCEGFCCPNSSQLGRELCLDDTATEDAITALRDAGIRTFVVGIPGTEAYATHLNSFAVAGGATDSDGPEDYFAVTAAGGVEGLTSVFTSITTRLIDSCEVQLQGRPATEDLVNVAVDCEVVPQSAESGSGWVLDLDSDPATIVLEGPVCEWIETQGVERVDVVFGCPTVR